MSSSPHTNAARVRDLCIFAMLGTVMLCSKLLMEALPNVHLLGMLTVAYTAVYRTRALIPIYIYVFLNGLIAGFNLWWVPYLYIWSVLWGLTMLLPRRMPRVASCIVYPLLCGVHGFAFGTLYAPAQALMFGFNAEKTLAWIVAGLPFDLIHGISNTVMGLLAYPVTVLLRRLSKS